MQSHVIAASRWLWWRRHEIAVATALACTLALLACVGPLLLAMAAVEWKYGKHRNCILGVLLAALLARTALWLWRELRDVPHGRWHPCAQCGAPIEHPSRAWYCSPACRRYARLRRYAAGGDEDAQAQLARLRHPASYDPALAKVPF